jgi:hypothetical protein
MTAITDEQMRALMPTAQPYSVVILRVGPNRQMSGVDDIIWEHGRRNFSLRADGVLSIVCPVRDGSDVCGIAIFAVGSEETGSIMDGDPGVEAGVFVYEVHPCRSFPGDALPG